MASIEGQTQYIDIQRFTGMNTLDEPHIIDPSESPYMVNMNLTQNGAIITRYGYEQILVFAGTGGIQGLIPAYFTNTLYDGLDVLRGPVDTLVIFYDGYMYYITTESTTPVAISGTYGADRNYVHGMMFKDYLIFGNGATGNEVKKWDGSIHAVSTLDSTVPNASIFSVFQGSAMYAGDTEQPDAVFFSEINTIDTAMQDELIAPGNGQIVTGLVANNDTGQVFKENSIYGMNKNLVNDGSYTALQVQPVVNQNGGAFGGGTIQAALGYTYFLSKSGVQTYGSSDTKITGNLPLPLSYKIDPTIKSINMSNRETFTSAYYDQKYMIGVPIRSQISNSTVLIYDENFKRRFGVDNWVSWSLPLLGIFAVFRNNRGQDQLYFSSNTEPRLYKFNTTFSDDGNGYMRLWRSKTFRLGERTQWQYVDLEGSKPINAILYCDIVTDGISSQPIEITNDDFIRTNTQTGYLGDSYLGDQYTGAAFATGDNLTPMYRWKKRVRIPQEVNYGYEMYFQVYNDADNEGWKLTRAKIAFIMDPDDPSYAFTD